MKFVSTPLERVQIVETVPAVDPRGSFGRLWCGRELRQQGWSGRVAQCSLSYNRSAGTVRGLHFQLPPSAEEKMVRCLAGAIFDVALDLRPDSSTYLQWYATELTPENGLGLLIPPGCAHGFQTLLPDSQVIYFISTFHSPSAARGVRWNDPRFGIPWPRAVTEISTVDRDRPDFIA